MTLNDADLRRALIDDLHSSGTDFQENADGTLCYPAELRVQMLDRIVDLRLRALPTNEFVIAGGAFADRVFEELDKSNIIFTYREAGAEIRLLITDAAQAPRAREIIHEAAQGAFDASE